ncbi:MAG: hypothetical protein ABW189_08075 [Rickettsiales bacterium]
MGGTGSGSYYRWRGKKETAEGCRCLDLTRMYAEGAVPSCGRRSGTWVWQDATTGERVAAVGYEADTRVEAEEGPYLRVFYAAGAMGQQYDYRLPLAVTFPRYGGKRFWFRCLGCAKRTLKLYLHSSQAVYICRTCRGLTYASRQESPIFRALSQAQKINYALGGDGNVIDAPPLKPKGMHESTYDTKVAKMRRLRDKILRHPYAKHL